MKKNTAIALLLLLASCGTKTGETENKETKNAATEEQTGEAAAEPVKNAGDFIPKGYNVLDSISGDFNLDSHRDLLLVLNKQDEEKTSDVIDHPERRPLLILEGREGNGYALAARNDNSVLCVNCGGIMGDPFQGLSAEGKGSFSVLHYGGSAWRWTKNLVYTYSQKDKTWYLKEISEENYHNADPEKVETKARTAKDFGKVKFADFDIYEE